MSLDQIIAAILAVLFGPGLLLANHLWPEKVGARLDAWFDANEDRIIAWLDRRFDIDDTTRGDL